MEGLRNYGYKVNNGITEKRKRLKELHKEGKELHIEWCNLEFHNLHCFNLDIEEERFEYEQMCDELKVKLDKIDEEIEEIGEYIVSEGYKMYL